MKRKFRVWDKIVKEWAEDYVGLSYLGYLFPRIGTINNDNLVLQFTTGKFDNKGIEIYEGDIIYYRHKFEHGDLHEGRAEVIWDEEIAAFSFDGFTWLDTNIMWDSITVVGNKFDNNKDAF